MIDTIVNSFDVWTDAQGIKSKGRVKGIENISLEGIENLRKLIIELAISGKLVSQKVSKESSSVLLKTLIAEKTAIEKEAKKKKKVTVVKIEEQDKPFDLPISWNWVRLGRISEDVHYGYNASATEQIKEYRLLRITDIQNHKVNWQSVPGCEISEETAKKYLLNDGDLLIARTGGTIGKSYLVKDIDLKAVFASYLIRVKKLPSLYSEYIKVFLSSPLYWKQLYKSSMGTGQPNVNGTALKNLILPFPPLEEQKRIVAKVDELMALCDKLEQERETNLKTHQLLVKTILESLTQTKDTDELQVAWERMSTHFDTLFCTEDSIEQLKKTILQLGIMGKLVKQDPNDESAEILHTSVIEAKETLIKSGELRRTKVFHSIQEKDIPFNLPFNWKWLRLGEIGICGTGKTPKTSISDYFGGNIPFIGPGQIDNSGNISQPEKFLTKKGIEHSTEANPNDIVMVCIGGSIGKSAIVKNRMAFNQQLNAINPLFVNSTYLYYSMNSSQFQRSIIKKSTGSATPIINRTKWEELLISLPPLEEQKRIVNKVQELFAICNSLSKRLKESQKLKSLLSETIIKKAV